MSVPCTVIVPDNASKTKVEAIKQYGGDVVPLDYAIWRQVITSHHYDGAKGKFIHPSCDRNVIAGNHNYQPYSPIKVSNLRLPVNILIYFSLQVIFV